MSTAEPAVAFGGLVRRVAAFLVDAAIEVTLMLPVGMGIGNVLGSDGSDVAGVIATALGLLFDSVYFTAFESSPLQASPGKWLLGLRVTDLDGRRISLLRASGRYLGKGLSAVLLLLGFVMIAFHRRKQGLHDVLARTLVLRGRVTLSTRLGAPSPSPMRP